MVDCKVALKGQIIPGYGSEAFGVTLPAGRWRNTAMRVKYLAKVWLPEPNGTFRKRVDTDLAGIQEACQRNK